MDYLFKLLFFVGFCMDFYKVHGAIVKSTKYNATAFNFRQRFLVLHYTALEFNESIRALTGKYVSSHYLVPKGLTNGEPVVYQLVHENDRAWSQGYSQWKTRTNLNDQGVSIEIVNVGHNNTKVYQPFPTDQINMVIELSKDIIQRYRIDPTDVIGHADVAPTRKYDPGPLFPWKTLFDNGVGAWPTQTVVDRYKVTLKEPINLVKFSVDLRMYGFDTKILKYAVRAFQMHFRPSKYDGVADVETYAILKALLKKYHKK